MIDSYTKLPIAVYDAILAIPYDLPEEDRAVSIIALLTGKTEREVLNAPLEEFSAWVARSRFLDREKPVPGRVAASYVCGGFRLIPAMDFRKITAAQFIDFQSFSHGTEQEILVPVLSCLMVPEGCTYGEGYDFDAVREAIRQDLSVADALSLYAFFLTKFAEYVMDTRTSLARELRKVKDPARRAELTAQLEEADRMLRTLSASAGTGSQPSTKPARRSAAPGPKSGR